MALSVWSTYMPLGIGSITLFAPFVLSAHGWRGLWALSLLMVVAAALAVHANRRHYAHAPHGGGWCGSSTQPMLRP